MYNEVSLGGTMKKGFTLIELLIVMVVLGILVTIAMPKYRASLERGRAMEGITNLRAASDALNAKYIMNENVYTDTGVVNASGTFIAGSLAKSRSFSAPAISSLSNTQARVQVVREGNEYTLTAVNTNGELDQIICSGDTELCQAIGAEYSGGSYIFDFTK